MSEFLDLWMVPTAITLGLLIWVVWSDATESFGGREVPVFQLIVTISLFKLLVAIIVSLAVWLVWSLVT